MKNLKITLAVRGKQVECLLCELAEKAKALELEPSGLARNIARVKQAVKEGRSGRVNSADGYQISYQL